MLALEADMDKYERFRCLWSRDTMMVEEGIEGTNALTVGPCQEQMASAPSNLSSKHNRR